MAGSRVTRVRWNARVRVFFEDAKFYITWREKEMGDAQKIQNPLSSNDNGF